MKELLKELISKNAVSEGAYNKLRPVDSKPETLYGLVKVQKPLKMDCHYSDPFFQR